MSAIANIWQVVAIASADRGEDWLSAHATLIVGVVGIVFSGLVGPSITAYFAGKREEEKDRRNLQIARQDNLRDVLDEAALILSGAVGKLRPLLAAAQAGDTLPKEPSDFLGSLAPLGHRLRLRLPDKDDVVATYDQAVRTLREVGRATSSQAVFDAAVQRFESTRDAFLEASRAKLSGEPSAVGRITAPKKGR